MVLVYTTPKNCFGKESLSSMEMHPDHPQSPFTILDCEFSSRPRNIQNLKTFQVIWSNRHRDILL